MKKILSYKVFNSSEELEQWQKDNPGVDVFSISPMVKGLGMQIDSQKIEDQRATGQTEIGAFVIYSKEVV